MSLFGNLIKKAVGQGISNAVEQAVEKTVTPTAEKYAEKANARIGEAAEAIEKNSSAAAASLQSVISALNEGRDIITREQMEIIWSRALFCFPRWSCSDIKSFSSDEVGDSVCFTVCMPAEEQEIARYVTELENAGFAGDTQIRRKTVSGHETIVDLTFAAPGDECEIKYYIKK